jgi:hypothetical protein
MQATVSFAIVAMMALTAGCGTSVIRDPVPPSFDADKVAHETIAMLDRNGNGTLEAEEVAAHPGLAAAFASIDTDNSQSISHAELTARFAKYQTALGGSVPACVYATLDGAPLAEAKITFEPEPFLDAILKPATGQTDANGRCIEFLVGGKSYHGLSAGLYRIKVEKEGAAIRACYNSATVLGQELVTDGRAAEIRVELNLSSQ